MLRRTPSRLAWPLLAVLLAAAPAASAPSATAPAAASTVSSTRVNLSLSLSPLTPSAWVARFQREVIAQEPALVRSLAPADRARVPLIGLATTSTGVIVTVTVAAEPARAIAIATPVRKELASLADRVLPPADRYAYDVSGPAVEQLPAPGRSALAGVAVAAFGALLIASAARRRKLPALRLPVRHGLPVVGALPNTADGASDAWSDLAIVLKGALPAGGPVAVVAAPGLDGAAVSRHLGAALDREGLSGIRIVSEGPTDRAVPTLLVADDASVSSWRGRRAVARPLGWVLVGRIPAEVATAYQNRVTGERLRAIASRA